MSEITCSQRMKNRILEPCQLTDDRCLTTGLLANMLMRTMLSVSGIALGLAIMVSAQVSPSGNMVCTVVGTGGLSCNGPGPIATRNDREKKSPQLLDRLFIVKPGAA